MPAIRVTRRQLRPLRHLAETLRTRRLELPYLLRKPPLGSADWLLRYGGLHGVRAEVLKGFDTYAYGLMTVVSQGLIVDQER